MSDTAKSLFDLQAWLREMEDEPTPENELARTYAKGAIEILKRKIAECSDRGIQHD